MSPIFPMSLSLLLSNIKNIMNTVNTVNTVKDKILSHEFDKDTVSMFYGSIASISLVIYCNI